MAKQIDFWTLLKLTQEYVSQHYAAVLTDKSKLNQLKAYVDKYLRDNDYHVENLNTEKAKSRLHNPRFVIPYSRAVKQQMLDGKLT
ncbi:MAG: hypothetical protein IKS28_02500 [Clostridia bacterium]|nr:hypothetical protein [Clostridia bacterium]